MPLPDLVLRRAVPEDADSAGTVQFTSWVETYTGLAAPEFWERASRERCVASWRRGLDDGLDAVLAETGGAVVGLGGVGEPTAFSGHPPARERELSCLYVLASHHGTGVGQALLDAVLPPGTPAQLWVARRNPRAVRFYERNGFVADGATDAGSFGGIEAFRMVR